ncbi:hypothetical protein FSHL1_012812 [Fusarium sambucinum]
MSTQNNTIPSYDNCHEVTCFCKVEYTISSDYLSKGASAFFVITFIILLLLPLWYGIRGKGDETTTKLREGLVIGGIAFQAVNMLCCATLMLIYAKRRRSSLRVGFEDLNRVESPPVSAENSVKMAKRTKVFCVILGIAYTAIIIRCTYRIFEALPATAAKVMRNEILFYVFDGGLILLATGLVTIFHPYKMFPTLGQKDKQEEQYGLQ